jgi:hypothetical protein
MKTIILAAAAAIGLSGCVGLGGYGSGISLGYGNGYGYNNYYDRYGYRGYGGYGAFGGSSCIAYDRFGRAFYTCGYGNYYGANRYIYSPRTVVYYYPGYTFRRGFYYDRLGRRVSSRYLYDRHHRRHRARG